MSSIDCEHICIEAHGDVIGQLSFEFILYKRNVVSAIIL